jgi:hypothetical protein
MRAVLGKELRHQFTERLQDELPQFRRILDKRLSRTDSVYEWRVADGLSFYLLLQVAPERDDFTVEVCWSRKNRFPLDVSQFSPADAPDGGQMRFRLSAFWARNDPWWTLGTPHDPWEELELLAGGELLLEDPIPRAMAKIPGEITDVILKVKQYAVPYFANTIATSGFAGATQASALNPSNQGPRLPAVGGGKKSPLPPRKKGKKNPPKSDREKGQTP